MVILIFFVNNPTPTLMRYDSVEPTLMRYDSVEQQTVVFSTIKLLNFFSSVVMVFTVLSRQTHSS